MSTRMSRHATKTWKGNHRRTLETGRVLMWGCREYLQHSFNRRGASLEMITKTYPSDGSFIFIGGHF